MKRLITLALLCVAAVFAQDGPTFVQSEGPPNFKWVSLFFRDGSSNTEYICYARAVQPEYTFRRSGSTPTITNIVDSANTSTVTFSAAHGLLVGNRITISGATVDTDLNGTYLVATVGATTTLTITTASVSDATYTEATLAIATTAARTSSPIWSVQRFFYTSTDVDRAGWGDNGNPAAICDDRASLSY
jgi:hypothetical protein